MSKKTQIKHRLNVNVTGHIHQNLENFSNYNEKEIKFMAPYGSRNRSVQRNECCVSTSGDFNDLSQKKIDVTSFKRSLKLLGLDISDFKANNPNRNNTPDVIRTAPKMCTRLLRRSISLLDIHTALQDSGTTNKNALDQVSREKLCQAVYEEWYFRKLQEARRKKAEEEAKDRQKTEQLEKEKEEKERKAKINFSTWKESKKEKEKTNEEISTPVFSHIKKSEDAYQSWKQRKNEELKKKLIEKENKLKEEEKRKRNEEEKRADAQKAFEAWKRKSDEILKQQAKKCQAEKKTKEMKKQEELKEKREHAETSFNYWKRKKDEDLKIKTKEERLSKKMSERQKYIAKVEREYVAVQAFEEWLNTANKRVSNNRHVVSDRIRRNSVPPWCPL